MNREVARILSELVAAGLLEVQRPHTGGEVDRPVAVLTSLMAREPPEFVAAPRRWIQAAWSDAGEFGVPAILPL